MTIIFSETSKKQLEKIPKSEQKKIVRKIEILLEAPLQGKQLKGDLHQFRSLRAWPYRIIYTLDHDVIVVHQIAHRQGVYK